MHPSDFRHNKLIARTLGILLVSALAISDLVGQQPSAWELLPNSPDAGELGRHEDIFFTDQTTGWVVNFRGELHRTSDAGETWELLNAIETSDGDPVRFRSTAWANKDLGWIGTLSDGHQLYQSSDGGHTLEDITGRLPAADSDGICGLWAVNENVVYGVGRFNGPGRLFKTIDGGLTWSVKNMDEWASRLIDVHFFDEMNGIVVGGTDQFAPVSHAVVLRTADGGETWEEAYRTLRFGEWAWKISFPSRDVGYVSIERVPTTVPAHVLKTNDGGLSWGEITIDDSLPLQGVGFITTEIGWTSGRGQSFATSSGGDSWQEIGLDGGINRFYNVGDSILYAVGQRVYKYTIKEETASESVVVPNPSIRLGQNFPNPFHPHTTVEYEVSSLERVRISVYDLLGRLVQVLEDAKRGPGSHRIAWDGTDKHGAPVPPGVYLYRLEAGGHTETRKMVLMRQN